MPTALFVSVSEAAAMLGIGRTTLYGYTTTGDLHLVHHGRKAVLAVSEICELATRLAQAAGVSDQAVVALRELEASK